MSVCDDMPFAVKRKEPKPKSTECQSCHIKYAVERTKRKGMSKIRKNENEAVRFVTMLFSVVSSTVHGEMITMCLCMAYHFDTPDIKKNV